MGTLACAGTALELDDRPLTHLQVVIVQKFRRGESFLLSWLSDPSGGEGRGSMWLTPAVPVFFTFDGSRVPTLDQAWVTRLSDSADGPRGLVVADADGQPIRVADHGHRFRTGHTTPIGGMRAGR